MKTARVTVTGLTTGRHILRIEKDGMAAYQVITARGFKAMTSSTPTARSCPRMLSWSPVRP